MTVPNSARSVLVVDDCKSNLLLYGALLTRAGFTVRKAASGREALDSVRKEQPSLMLLDYMMPGMDGSEVIRHLRANALTANLPIVVLTASVASADIDQALAAGANDYMNKPVDSRILLTRIRSIIQASEDRVAASAATERDALRLELDEAQAMQRAQLPEVPAKWPGWSATGGVVPSGQVAGDVFDIIQTPSGHQYTALIDVSGHGTASALVAAETRTGLRNLLAQYPLNDAVGILNNRMVDREVGKYACLAVVETCDDHVMVVNAGLPPVAILSNKIITEQVVASGFPTGMFRDTQYTATKVPISIGDRVVMVSDGLTEPYGNADDTEGVVARLNLTDEVPHSWSPQELERRLREAHAGDDDDATLLILERL